MATTENAGSAIAGTLPQSVEAEGRGIVGLGKLSNTVRCLDKREDGKINYVFHIKI